MSNGEATPAAQPYTGVLTPDPSGDGTTATGSWASPYGSFEISMLQGVPSQSKVQISGLGVTQIVGGAPTQFKAMCSLASHTLQLQGHCTNAQNQNTDPAVAPFVWVSRNEHIATVSNTGLVTLIGRGEVDIECQYPRASNAPFQNSTPSGTEFNSATLLLTITA